MTPSRRIGVGAGPAGGVLVARRPTTASRTLPQGASVHDTPPMTTSDVTRARQHSVGDLLHRTARRYPDKPAVVAGELRVTYAEFDVAVNRAAHAMSARGLRPGESVCASALALPFRDAVFDVVGAFDVLEHCEHFIEVLAKGAEADTAAGLADVAFHRSGNVLELLIELFGGL